jgi:succinyl-CoA synthetase alpha subunit
MTGSEGTKHTRRMVASGAKVVGGVTPGKAGQEVDGIPVFNNVQDADGRDRRECHRRVRAARSSPRPQ